MEEISSSVKTIEAEAERILELAKKRANEILLKAKEESHQILSSELPMEEVNAECRKIIDKAREEADRKIGDSRRKTMEIKTKADNKVEEIAQRMVSIITGAKSR